MSKQPAPESIDAYLAPLPAGTREILETVRGIVREEVSGATETIAYQMPAFRVERVFFYFAAFKKHLGIYPPVEGDEDLLKQLAPYLGPKGNLKFPFEEPIPYELIRRVVRALAKQYARR
ncbi:DUF1801 domain-containing protein [Luteolibacter flavescens]|uniref:DUF1801 domain-containing protein n=1 Tax=Luteolibacter flavescens TaxID=1859460 RepID=A0ABT3FKI2_9BACT|nr:DUF1801 domain-containing protein [Luteolibacter flavescens]MCW1884067.1 DUF1801 domain-containing protein [Luteolibacter flavescens]